MQIEYNFIKSALNKLHVALQFVVCNSVLPKIPLMLSSTDVMIDKLIAQYFACNRVLFIHLYSGLLKRAC